MNTEGKSVELDDAELDQVVGGKAQASRRETKKPSRLEEGKKPALFDEADALFGKVRSTKIEAQNGDGSI